MFDQIHKSIAVKETFILIVIQISDGEMDILCVEVSRDITTSGETNLKSLTHPDKDMSVS